MLTIVLEAAREITLSLTFIRRTYIVHKVCRVGCRSQQEQKQEKEQKAFFMGSLQLPCLSAVQRSVQNSTHT